MDDKVLSDQKDSGNTQPEVEAVPVSQEIRLKHDWYQTDSHVVITVLIKNVPLSGYDFEFYDKTVILKAKLSNGEDFVYTINLANAIVPTQSTFRISAMKVEIKMKKAEGIHWQAFEGKANLPQASSTTPAYPSSSSHKKDWGKIEADIEKEEEKEKPDGEAALNRLFQKIYADSSDEVRKAMNKSFVESGGTVLSTDWKEVSKKMVEVKPPEGTELKKWS